jgi:hypothetical protein
VAELLCEFNARIDRLELAFDVRLDPDRALEPQLDAKLARLRCRALPDRKWRRPTGCECRYLAHENAPLNACAYVRPCSKTPDIDGPVAHIEVRLRHEWLDRCGLDDPRRLPTITAARIATVHALLFEFDRDGTNVARVRARTHALGMDQSLWPPHGQASLHESRTGAENSA